MPDHPHANPAVVDLAERRPGPPPPGQVVRYRKNRRIVTTVEELNRRYGLLGGGKIFDIERCKQLPVTEFEMILADRVIFIGYDANNRSVYTPAARFWLGETGRRIISRLVFTSQPVADDELNLFRGFGVEPRPGPLTRILEHIRVVICREDEEIFHCLLDLLAWQVQNIGKPSRIIVVLYSAKQQTGKGVFVEHILVPIFGDAAYFTSEIENVVGTFNHLLQGKALVGLDECMYSGNKKIADAIKSISSASAHTMNEKFIAQHTIPFATNLFVLTNRRDAVHIEEGDQRYWVLPVSETKQADPAWFYPLFEEEINGEGLNAFLHFLLNRDITGFHPQRDIPRDNEEHSKIVQAGINAADPRNYFAECLEAGLFLGMREGRSAKFGEDSCVEDAWYQGSRILGSDLLAGYRAWVKSLAARRASAVPNFEFWNTATALGFDAVKSNGRRYRIAADPEACAEKLRGFIHG